MAGRSLSRTIIDRQQFFARRRAPYLEQSTSTGDAAAARTERHADGIAISSREREEFLARREVPYLERLAAHDPRAVRAQRQRSPVLHGSRFLWHLRIPHLDRAVFQSARGNSAAVRTEGQVTDAHVPS